MLTQKHTPQSKRTGHITGLLCLGFCLLWLTGCGNMAEQPKLDDPYGRSPVFGRAARDILPETVPVGFLREDEHMYAGTLNGEWVDTFPMEVTQETLELGETKYEAFCSPCHGYDGYGNGIIVEEGFPPAQSFHTEEFRNAPVGRFYQAITNGQGVMFSYASRVQPEERWAIIAYIRALQLSQNASFADLPPELQAEFNASAE